MCSEIDAGNKVLTQRSAEESDVILNFYHMHLLSKNT